MQTWNFPDAYPDVTERGPWNDEPDKAHWVDPASELDCLIVRAPLGNLCGYVGVPPGHPYHGLGLTELRPRGLRMHGGVTFADGCQADAAEDGPAICHVPEPGRADDVWWIGFDCMHAWDFVPAYAFLYERYRDETRNAMTYRDFGYVKEVVSALAGQLSHVARR